MKEVGSPKILKFPKSQSSVGCIARFQFLTHMVIINDQKSALEMAWEPSQNVFYAHGNNKTSRNKSWEWPWIAK